MGSKIEARNHRIDDFHCYLPVSGRQNAAGPVWQNHRIELYDSEALVESPRIIVFTEADVLAAWAILLGFYTGLEEISFVKLHNEASYNQSCDLRYSDANRTNIEAQMLHSCVSNNSLIRHVLAPQPFNPEESPTKLTLVNTAVLSSTDSKYHSDEENGVAPLIDHGHHKILDHVG